jgi:hypothetical protein
MTHQSARLVCHPDSTSSAVDRIEVRLLTGHHPALSVVFTAEGAMAGVRVPPPGTPRRTDGLWRHTCFEAFVGGATSRAYYEFNFAPSGEWAAYAFRDYRDREALELHLEPRIAARVADDRLQLEALVPLDACSFAPGEALRVGLSAVIEEQSGRLTYWAVRHPPGRPDFHHPDGFALQLLPA